jgi:hypothetical protein
MAKLRISTSWPFGPPDTVVGHWVDSISHFPCLIRVGPLGALCGYVAVPPGHRWHGKGYAYCQKCGQDYCWVHDADMQQFDVHGGVTFAGPADEEWGFAPEDWTVGFDCAHYFDYVPFVGIGNPADLRSPEWVASEVSKLAHQLAADAL